jgi:hypothetical protein
MKQGVDEAPSGPAVAPAAATPSWTHSYSDRNWFTPCLASDWVWLAFYQQASGLRSRIKTHSNGHCLQSLREVISTFEDVCSVMRRGRPSSGTLDSVSMFAGSLASQFLVPDFV